MADHTADHLASRSRSRSRSRRSAADAAQPAVAAQPSQSVVAAQPSQSAAQPLQPEVAAQQGVWSLDDAARLIAVLQQSERQGRMSHTTVCRLQGPPPSLILTVNLPQTGDTAVAGAPAPLVENAESEHGGSDDAEVEPDDDVDDMAEQPDEQRLWQMVRRLQSYVKYLDRWSWRTWQELRQLRSRIAAVEGVNRNP